MGAFQKFSIESLFIFTELSLHDEESISGGQDVVAGNFLNTDSLSIDGNINGVASINRRISSSRKPVNAGLRAKSFNRDRKSIRNNFKIR
jgi:hypothetical protein